jgi:hypothetical protein
MKNNGSAAEEEITKEVDITPFLEKRDEIEDLETYLHRAHKLADQAGEVLNECRDYLSRAMDAFKAIKG